MLGRGGGGSMLAYRPKTGLVTLSLPRPTAALAAPRGGWQIELSPVAGRPAGHTIIMMVSRLPVVPIVPQVMVKCDLQVDYRPRPACLFI